MLHQGPYCGIDWHRRVVLADVYIAAVMFKSLPGQEIEPLRLFLWNRNAGHIELYEYDGDNEVKTLIMCKVFQVQSETLSNDSDTTPLHWFILVFWKCTMSQDNRSLLNKLWVYSYRQKQKMEIWLFVGNWCVWVNSPLKWKLMCWFLWYKPNSKMSFSTAAYIDDVHTITDDSFLETQLGKFAL